jgi:hypothetical protein
MKKARELQGKAGWRITLGTKPVQSIAPYTQSQQHQLIDSATPSGFHRLMLLFVAVIFIHALGPLPVTLVKNKKTRPNVMSSQVLKS